MNYFIGAQVPKNFKNKIEMLRAEFRYFSTEPHITLIPPPVLPIEDSFIEGVIEICKNTRPIDIHLDGLKYFGNRVLYIGVNSPGIIKLHKKLYAGLNLQHEKREFTPHLTIVKQRPRRIIDIERIRKRAEIKLIPYPKYTLNSIIIYHQPIVRSIYVPYMKIPLGY